MSHWLRFTVWVFGLILANAVQAHQTSTAYLNLNSDNELIQSQYQVKLVDMAMQIDLDLDNNAAITWAEVKVQQQDIEQWLQTHLFFSHGGNACEFDKDLGVLMDSHFNEPYLVIEFTTHCQSGKPDSFVYQGMFDSNSGHKILVNYTANGELFSRVLSSNTREMQLTEHANTAWQTFKDYTYQGVVHILIGLDHIMFLLCLLLSATMVNRFNLTRHSFKATIWQALGLVTVFTLAHSVTLVLTALSWLSFPSRWVEIIIALTVGVAALNNIWPFIQRFKLVTFLFGLMHGMGFAGVLGELGLPVNAKLMPILAFNFGVEIGQVFLISLILPVIFLLDRVWENAQMAFKFISALILILAVYWIIMRY